MSNKESTMFFILILGFHFYPVFSPMSNRRLVSTAEMSNWLSDEMQMKEGDRCRCSVVGLMGCSLIRER